MRRPIPHPPEEEPLVWPREWRARRRWLPAYAWVIWSLCLGLLACEFSAVLWQFHKRGMLSKKSPLEFANPGPQVNRGLVMAIYEGTRFEKLWGVRTIDGDLVVPIDGNTFPTPFPFWKMSARLSGRLIVPQDGEYRFAIAADDGSRLSIDGKVLIDLWPNTSVSSFLAPPMVLTAGEHPFLLEVCNASSGGWLALEWILPSGERRLMNGNDFVLDVPAASEAP